MTKTLIALLAAMLTFGAAPTALAQPKKHPNILILWGDDVSWFNVSAFNHGTMGYKTPNIDRIARQGAMFTDWYG